MAPTIGVVITCFNKARFLESALRAVFAQVRAPDEVVFVDDGSTDTSLSIARDFVASNPSSGMRILTQPNSGQPAHARNAGIATLQTEIVICLDADDSVSPLYLAAVEDAFRRDPDIGLAYPTGIAFGADALRMISSQSWDPVRLSHTNYMLCVTAFRREIWERVGGYRTNVRGYEDWDFWIAASALGYRGALIPLQLFHYREALADGVFASTKGHDLALRAAIVLNNPTIYDEPTRALAQALLSDAPVDVLASWSTTHEILRTALLEDARRVSTDALQWAQDRATAGEASAEAQRLTQRLQTTRPEPSMLRQLGALLLVGGSPADGYGLLLGAWAMEREARVATSRAAAVRQAEGAPTRTRAARVLSYMPYGRWNVHALQEMTILHGARLRGADVRYILCDGMFRECDMHWAATLPRTAQSCAICIAGQHQQADGMRFPHEWLGAHVTAAERTVAAEWAASRPVTSLLTARWDSWEIGEWVQSSVHSHFRVNTIDPAISEHERVYRAYLEAGLLTAFAISRLIREWEPDVLLQFNGRQATTRVSLEIARAAGVRVLTHERGFLSETMYLAVNADCISLGPIREAWSRWCDEPLTVAECEQVSSWLTDRAHGRKLNWAAFTPAPDASGDVRTVLRLRAHAPCLVVFTSSEDEIIAAKEYASPFGTQIAWLEQTVAWAQLNPDIDMVIRVHPNTGGKRSLGRNEAQLDELYAFAKDLPTNVRIVWPDDDVSSYALLEIATGALAYVSTIALESACRGIPTLLAASTISSGHGFTDDVVTLDAYPSILRLYADGEADALAEERRTLAYRFAYLLVYRYCVPFPLVQMPTYATSQLAYSSLDVLRPGQQPTLDRAVSILLDGTSVCPDPSNDRESSAATEAEWHTTNHLRPARHGALVARSVHTA